MKSNARIYSIIKIIIISYFTYSKNKVLNTAKKGINTRLPQYVSMIEATPIVDIFNYWCPIKN